jgi:CubicO group peptidase (beta-lactamase class C family)
MTVTKPLLVRSVVPLLPILAGVAVLAAAPTSRRIDAPGLPGIDSLFAALARDTTHDIKGVLVVRDDHVVAERYFNGDDSSTLHDIRSATKSITGLLTGIAIDQGLIVNVDVPLSSLLPLPLQRTDTLRLRDLLTMQSGLDSDDRDSLSAGNEVRLDRSDDWLAFAAHVPMVHRPGERYIYSSLNAYLLGAAVEHAAHEPLATFAERNLFAPLGSSDTTGDADPEAKAWAKAISRSRSATWPRSVPWSCTMASRTGIRWSVASGCSNLSRQSCRSTPWTDTRMPTVIYGTKNRTSSAPRPFSFTSPRVTAATRSTSCQENTSSWP